MVTVPGARPVTRPVVGTTGATDGLLLLHVPPGSEFVRIVALPWQTVVAPPIAAGCAFTVKVTDATHPAGVVYFITLVPAATPVTTPVIGATVATPGVMLLQVPPGVASLSVVELPAHTDKVPVIGASGFTVNEIVAIQPAGVV